MYDVGAVAVREAPVVEVVAGPERPAGDDGLPGDALVEASRSGSSGQLESSGRMRARRVGPAQQAATRVDQVDPGAVGVEQAGGLVDARAGGRPARSDAALIRAAISRSERSTSARSASSLREWSSSSIRRALRHGRGRVVGQRPDERDLRRV